MAENNPNQDAQSQGVVSNNFNKGMLKDYNETFVGEGLYTHARNAVNNCCKECGKVVQANVCGCTNTVPQQNIAVVGFQGIII
jgi:hypothetical protein